MKLVHSVFILFATIALPSYSFGIIGGGFFYEDKISDKVFTLDLRANQTSIICTGASISQRHILTAAHCFNHFEPKICKNGAEHCPNKLILNNVEIKEFTIQRHPQYKTRTEMKNDYLEHSNFDIAIITISQNTFDRYFKISKPYHKQSDAIQFYGFGMTRLKKVKSPLGDSFLEEERGRLKKATFKKIILKNGLAMSNATHFKLKKNIFLKKMDDSAQILRSDSGGPLVVKNKIVGLARNYTISDKTREASGTQQTNIRNSDPNDKISIQSYFTLLNDYKTLNFINTTLDEPNSAHPADSLLIKE